MPKISVAHMCRQAFSVAVGDGQRTVGTKIESPPKSGKTAGTPAALKSNAGASSNCVIQAVAETLGSRLDFAASSSACTAFVLTIKASSKVEIPTLSN
ncbi:MAG: hypothetical protein GY949_07925 [Gammaproteobacteria bacterium]|nr:hypothetical protein [Gammaproteobacteria bacterium]